MSDSTDRKSVAEQPLYILWVLLLVGTISLLTLAIPLGLYLWAYGIPQFPELLTTPVHEYRHAVIWNQRVWYPVLKVGPNSDTGVAEFASFDPVKGGVENSALTTPNPLIGLVADGDHLWSVTTTSVTRYRQGNQVEDKPKRKLGRTSEPFLYEGKVAVIELTSLPYPELLQLVDGEWTAIGDVLIPFALTTTMQDDELTLVKSSSPSKLGARMMDVKVIPAEGQYHLFVSDGAVVAYHQGIEFATNSAETSAEGQEAVDDSNLDAWQAVCQVPGGRSNLRGWKAGIAAGTPIVVATGSAIGNPFQRNSLVLYRKQQEKWQKSDEKSTPAMLSLVLVSDGQNLYTAAQSVAQTLRLFQVTDGRLKQTGVALRAPVTPMQQPLERVAEIYKWVYWPGLLILALSLSRLMSVHLSSDYQFGNTTVQLASYTRRGFAKLIDSFVYWIPNYLLAVLLGVATKEQVAENMDRLLDSDGSLGPMGLFFIGALVSGLVYLTITSITQGRWGITVGKWICGIRTVRTTLRPCGFFRALVRDLLFAIDTFPLMSYIPITLIFAFSQDRQRLGDMVADTIVIRTPRTSPTTTVQPADPKSATRP